MALIIAACRSGPFGREKIGGNLTAPCDNILHGAILVNPLRVTHDSYDKRNLGTLLRPKRLDRSARLRPWPSPLYSVHHTTQFSTIIHNCLSSPVCWRHSTLHFILTISIPNLNQSTSISFHTSFFLDVCQPPLNKSIKNGISCHWSTPTNC